MSIDEAFVSLDKDQPNWCYPSELLLSPGCLTNDSLSLLVYTETLHAIGLGIISIGDLVKKDVVLNLCQIAMQRSARHNGRTLYNKLDLAALGQLENIMKNTPLYPLHLNFHLNEIDMKSIEQDCYAEREAETFNNLSNEERRFVRLHPIIPTFFKEKFVQKMGTCCLLRLQAGYYESLRRSHHIFTVHVKQHARQLNLSVPFETSTVLEKIGNKILLLANVDNYWAKLEEYYILNPPGARKGAFETFKHDFITGLIIKLPAHTTALHAPSPRILIGSDEAQQLEEVLQKDQEDSNNQTAAEEGILLFEQFDRIPAHCTVFQIQQTQTQYGSSFYSYITFEKAPAIISSYNRITKVLNRMESFDCMDDFDSTTALDEYEGRNVGSLLALPSWMSNARKSTIPNKRRHPFYVPPEFRHQKKIHRRDVRPNYFIK
jgi:hypothetical protein